MTTDQTSWHGSSVSVPLPPLVPGLPILGNALPMAGNPLQYFVEQYRRYGPIFRIKVLNKPYTVLGGLEANRFLISGNEVFSSHEALSGMGRELGTEKLLLAMDGPEHVK